ncbi:MAG TPA: hypothetical protein VFK45_09130, partial [Gammaproteobacteria bacterium]|nr:hypothetical protein [Gammaproteobacteria bacterium]
LTDQRIGGLITWIPAAMMSVLGGIIVLRRWMHEENIDRRPAQSVATKSAAGKKEEHAYA